MPNPSNKKNPSQLTSSDEESTQPSAAATEKKAPMRVVGIGASAGGLAALKELLPNIPEKTNACFVIVMHLSCEHKSHLADLLQASTPLPVEQLTETTLLEANHIYVIPPGANIEAVEHSLQPTGIEESRQKRAPIDHFFRTLSKAHAENAVGIILTGTGSDGTSGLRFIREAGGLTIVQSPDEAEYDSMPRSVIAIGVADMVLPLKEIPAQIHKIAKNNPAGTALAISPSNGESDEVLHKILNRLRAKTGHDFSRYKRATISRRILRRMQLHRVKDLEAYLDVLQSSEKEVTLLFEDLLITVTEFFRDPDVFAYLEATIIPKLLAANPESGSVRVWSVGCASGEEAYSLCMLLLEAQSKQSTASKQLQIFATDLHEPSLAQARESVYPKSIEANVSKKRLDEFFTSDEHHYRVKRPVREQIVFALHNMLQDPPFSRLQLISCRNVLIYMKSDLQLQLISMFHYALEEDGYLLVGSADGLDTELFICENKKLGLYRRRSVPTPGIRSSNYPLTTSQQQAQKKPSKPTPPASSGKLHEQAVELYAPPSLLMDERGEMLHYSARAGRYLQLLGGTPTRNVFQLLPENLRQELRSALHARNTRDKGYRSPPLQTSVDGQSVELVLRVQQIEQPHMQGHFLVIFDEIEIGTGEIAKGLAESNETNVSELKSELNKAKAQTQLMSDEHEQTLERMQASNEELESSNEELRSAMEELGTSKEEMESINEELNSLNQENLQKVEELNKLSSDLNNLLKATHIATIFLDKEMRIMRFTPKVKRLFNLRSIDQGRGLSEITHQLKYNELGDDIRCVLENDRELEREVEDERGQSYLARLQCYRTADAAIGGIVISFIDISERQKGEKLLQKAKELAEKILESVRTPMLVLEHDLSMRSANQAFLTCFQSDTPGGLKGKPLYKLDSLQWNQQALREQLERIIPESTPVVDFEIDVVLDDNTAKTLLVNASQIDREDLILMSLEDVTERKLDRLKREESKKELERQVTERTVELHQKTDRLQGLVHELSTAEQRERKRMASILHDDLQQLLVAAKMQIEMSQRESANGKTSDSLKRAISHLDDSLETTQFLVRQSNPKDLYEKGLFPAIESLCAEMQNKHGLKVRYQLPREAFQLGSEYVVLLYESLRELFFNIVKHAKVEEAELSFRLSPDALSVSVADDGVGFEVDAKSNQKNPSEFGLFSVCSRIEAMGGDCQITSSPGQGTTVAMRFTLNNKQSVLPFLKSPQRVETGSANQKRMSRQAPYRMVVVDDHVLVREGIVKILNADSRIEIVGEATDGNEALATVAKCEPDIVLMDINMPRMNGIVATREILRKWPDILVVALSMQDMKSEEARAMAEVGAVGFLQKSDDSGKMIATLLALINA